MKVVGFKSLGKKKKAKKVKIFCVGKVFFRYMVTSSFLLAFFVMNLFNNGFSSSLKQCIQNFVSSMGNIGF